LAPTEPTDNVLIAYAAGDGTTASDGDGRNSPFTTALLRHIETPGLEISFLFRRVRDDVMAATKREQQPFVYGSLSKEEIYLKAPAISTPVKPATDPTATASTDDEKFWQAIQTSTVAGLFEEYLSRYPRGAHVTEARQRIKDLAVRQVSTAPADSTSPQPDSPPKPGSAGLDGKPSDRNLYTADDARKVAAIGATQQLVMPAFSIDASVSDIKGPYAKFVGVWSSKAGWGKGAGRHAMVIILGVSATGSARGYYLWGPPTKQSWVQDPAGNHFFAEHIENDKFSITANPVVHAELDRKNVLTLSVSKSDKPTDKATVELRPLWQLVQVPETPEPSTKHEHTSRPERNNRQETSSKKETLDRSSTPSAASGPTMEERYRACKKLVNGFARREACARTGSI
jgi:Caspase domain